ncbi:hypothetical protein AAV94_06265 [Lampropedia cohaerens]|uniref:ABC transporter ATP-binding protein n=1 Tax=Lampropedia cohaerens TaxID=1610491 RepID=A0A0U1Q0A7_9BURK|nr:thiol reductant ABC exporter subunit CydD [Lampropedia cohaerens]KKW68187.1 hypothetical protein AAV94_06265 [Lampropedia cohaerens]
MNSSSPRASWHYALQGVAALVWIAQAWLIAGTIADLMDYEVGGALAAADVLTPIWQAALAVALLGLLRAALEYWGVRATYGHARRTLTALRKALGERLRNTSPLDARRPPSGQITSAWMEQAEAVVPWLARYQAAQWRVMIATPVILLFVAWHSWVAALLLLLAAPLIPLFMAIIGWRAQAISEEQLEVLGQLHGHLLERLRGLPTLRAMRAVDATAARLTALGQRVARKTMRVLRVAMLSSAVLELFSALGVALVAVYVGFHLLGQLPFGAWNGRLSLHAGLFVLMLAPAFFEPLRELSAVWHDRANGKAAVQTMQTLLDGLAPMVDNGPPAAGAEVTVPAVTDPRNAPQVELQGVRPALAPAAEQHNALAHRHSLTVSIPAGAHVAVTGPSGSGKSMLLALVAGLVAAERGEVRIGGIPLTAHSAPVLRQRMGWLGAQPHFVSGSLQRNLHWGDSADPAADARTLQAVGLEHLAGRRLGEAGSGLSGGEALRLALARLQLHAGCDLLLLDEPTAHLDGETAALVRATIMRLAIGKTLLVATHDPLLMAALPYTLTLDGHGHAQLLGPAHGHAAQSPEVQA